MSTKRLAWSGFAAAALLCLTTANASADTTPASSLNGVAKDLISTPHGTTNTPQPEGLKTPILDDLLRGNLPEALSDAKELSARLSSLPQDASEIFTQYLDKLTGSVPALPQLSPSSKPAPGTPTTPAKAAPAPTSGKNDHPDKTYIIVDGNGKERVVSKDEFFRLKQQNEKIKQHNEKIKQDNEKIKQDNDALAREKAEYSDPNKAYASDLVEINKLRASHGLPPVQHDPALDAQAQQWSNNMASKKNAYHTGLNIVENVSSIPSLKGSFTAFRDSTSGHKKNMLSKDVTKVGLGYAQDEDGQWYVTQMFQ